MIRFLLILCGIFPAFHGFTQLSTRPINFKNPVKVENARKKAATQDQIILQLPFWDDFSTASGSPDTTRWINGGVFINPDLGINPPSLNVASFDGADEFGNPYNAGSNSVLKADSLTSHAIDLSNINLNKVDEVYLSFFWQVQGTGELPNTDDSLRLQFLSADSVWITQWVITGGIDNVSNSFQQEILPVNTSFQHEVFRFRFQNFNSQKGEFDNWNIDYIYLNQDRNANDLQYFDRAITTRINNIHSVYQTIPRDFLDSFQLQNVSFGIFSHEDPADPQPMNLFSDMYVNGEFLVRLHDGEPILDPDDLAPIFGQERFRVNLNTDVIQSLQLPPDDSLGFEIRSAMQTGDMFFIKEINITDTTFLEDDAYNYRVNDSLVSQLIFDDELAYDDGTAEFAAGISQNTGALAVRYIIPNPDTLTGVRIYFPAIAPISNGSPIELEVWTELDDEGDPLHSQSSSVVTATAINRFSEYVFDSLLIVSDTFFIGFKQFKNDFIAVGLDKSTDNSDQFFQFINGFWSQDSVNTGNLMIRPVFGSFEAGIVTAIPEQLNNQNLKIYPNPNSGTFYVQSNKPWSVLRIVDLSGKVWNFHSSSSDHNQVITHLPPGIYIVQIKQNNKLLSRKIVVR